MRWSYKLRYHFYDKIMDIFTYSRLPVWAWALRRQERLQKREKASGRPWRMNNG